MSLKSEQEALGGLLLKSLSVLDIDIDIDALACLAALAHKKDQTLKTFGLFRLGQFKKLLLELSHHVSREVYIAINLLYIVDIL